MRRVAPLLALLLAAGAAGAAGPGPEARLASVFQAVEADQTDLALARVNALIQAYPNFRLAYLVRGDLLLAHARPLQTFGNVPKTVPQDRIDGLREEALMRMRALRDHPAPGQLPSELLELEPQQKYALVVDSSRSRLYVFANHDGLPSPVADYYVTLGKRGVEKTREGDQKTPIGVYHVVADLPRRGLSDVYGAGAYPINYPNTWDRRLGRTGHGIWLHGVPSDVYSRAPRASDGCIALSNADLEAVGRYVQVGLTPVVIADRIEWTDAASIVRERDSVAAALESWRVDWESRDTARYLSHYSSRFSAGGEDYAAWARHKRKVNDARHWIKVGISRVAMFRYPLQREFIVVTFDQDYRSDTFSNRMRKRQYWVKEGADWKIIYEGPV